MKDGWLKNDKNKKLIDFKKIIYMWLDIHKVLTNIYLLKN